MEDDRAFELFEKDINSIKMPDLWVKVKTAVENYQLNSPIGIHNTAYNKNRKYVYAAACCFSLIFLMSLVLYLVSQNDTFYETESTVSEKAPAAKDKTVFPKATVLKHSFALTEKPRNEIESIVGTIKDTNIVYEDSSYIYVFDNEGLLEKMVDISSQDDIDLEATAKLLIQRHFPGVFVDNYRITIDKTGEYPALRAQAEVKSNGLDISDIRIRFYTNEWTELLGLE